jgi:hypothetical protein
MQLHNARHIGGGLRGEERAGKALNRFKSIGPLFLRRMFAPISYKQKSPCGRLYLRVFSPPEIMNPMNIKSTSFLFLLLMAILPTFGQVSAPYDKRNDGSVKDEQAHIDAKTKWIKDHPEEYRKAGGNPEAVLGNPIGVVVDNSTSKTSAPKGDFQAKERLVVLKAEAVPVKGKSVGADLLKAENQALAKEYPAGKVEIQRDTNGKLRIYSADKFNLHGTETRQGKALTWNMNADGCVECAKAVQLYIEEEGPTQVIYLMQNEDEDALVSYRLTLQPIQR